MSEAIRGIHHVGIVVQDLEASAAWYAEHFGFVRSFGFELPGVQAAFLARGSLRLELFQSEGAAPMAEARRAASTNLRIGGINHFAIDVADLDATVAELGRKGVALVSPPREVPNSGGDRFAFVHDNEGMLVELVQPAAAPG